MATGNLKAQCVPYFIERKLDTHTQRNYRTRYGKDPQPCSSFRACQEIYEEGDSYTKIRVDDQEHLNTIEDKTSVRQALAHFSAKSIRNPIRQLQLLRSTVRSN